MENTVTEVHTDSILIPVSAEMQRELICKLRCIDGNMPIRKNLQFSDGINSALQVVVQVLCNPQNQEMRLSQVCRLAKMTEIPVIYYLTQENGVQNCYAISTDNEEMCLLGNVCYVQWMEEIAAEQICLVTGNAEDVGHIPAMLLGYYRSIHPEAVEIAKLDIIRFHETNKKENESIGTPS